MGPLSGVKVIEMAGLAPGPYAAMLLADLGAEVLRIDRPDAPEAKPGAKPNLVHRNRRAIALDIKSKEGLSTLRRLIASSDALIEGFRPGVMERLGVGPEECIKANPKLVYGRVTGWGQDGPLAQAAGHDTRGAVLGSDAFFPFRDGIDQAAEAGISAIVQPGGSVKDEEVIAAADEHGIAMVFTGQRQFRH